MIIAQLLLALAQADPPTPAPPPHIVFVMVDDLGWRDTSPAVWPEGEGAVAPGARHFQTPALERLAREGVRFSQAYASAPVCTPTRTSLMTGRAPARTGITYWTRHADRDTSASHPVLRAPQWNVNGLQPGDVTLAGLLRGAGYRTIHVGKAHFGTGRGGDPLELGFDVNIAGWAAGAPASYYGRDHFGAARRAQREGRDGGRAGRDWDVPGLAVHHGKDVYLTDVLAGEAVAALRAAISAGERAFLHFAPYGVHAPLMVNPRVAQRFEGSGLEGPELAYATMVASVDDALGELLRAVDELGIAEETIVVYTSDNGGLSAHSRGGARHGHNAPLRSGKGSGYEGGLRVPLVVRWPGVTAAGRVETTPCITHDWFPTLLAAAGAQVPREPAGVEGIDLRPILAGAEALPGRALYWHQPHFWGVSGPGIEPFSAVLAGGHKLLHFHADERLELYDLAADPGETSDQSRAAPAHTAQLAEQLSLWLEASAAPRSVVIESGATVPLPRVSARRATRSEAPR